MSASLRYDVLATPRIPAQRTKATTSAKATTMLTVPDAFCPVASWTASPSPVICSCRYGSRNTTPRTATRIPKRREPKWSARKSACVTCPRSRARRHSTGPRKYRPM